jgi:hypothetical protein
MLFAACAEQPRCSRVYGDLLERHMAAIEAHADEPIRIEVDGRRALPDRRGLLLPGSDRRPALQPALRGIQSPGHPGIIAGLTRAAERRDETLFKAIALAEGMGGGFGISMGMSAAVRCMDGYVAAQAEAAPADFAPTRPWPAFGDLEVISRSARILPLGRPAAARSRDFSPVETELPVLVANGAWDPITPVPLAELIMPGFANGAWWSFRMPATVRPARSNVPAAG